MYLALRIGSIVALYCVVFYPERLLVSARELVPTGKSARPFQRNHSLHVCAAARPSMRPEQKATLTWTGMPSLVAATCVRDYATYRLLCLATSTSFTGYLGS